MVLLVSHPDGDLLEAYGAGLLEPDQHATVESHVLECDSCWRTLSHMPQDAFVSLVRESWTAKQFPTRAGCDTGASGEAIEGLPAALANHPRYRVLARCGTGGMGVVYRAEHRLMGREVALKIVRPELLRRPSAVERFRREVRAAASLAHPNVVPAYDAEEADGVHFLAMEFVTGHDLAESVGDSGPLPVDVACGYIRQAALGLAHAHARGMVHRDIKPQNLMLTPDGQVKILDFGLSKFASEAATRESADAATPLPASDLTRASTTLGTPDYVAPEQALSPGAADIRADIYALGATLYFLLAGRPPFAGRDRTLHSPESLESQPITEFRDDVPPALVELLRRMLAAAPNERLQTPAEVVTALDSFLATGENAGDRPVRRFRRFNAFAAAGALGMLLIAVAAVVRYSTPAEGIVTIDTDSPDVRVIVEGQDRQPVLLDAISRREMTFAPGEYTVRFAGNPNGLAIFGPTGGTFLLRRGETEVIRIRRTNSKGSREPDPLVELRSLGAKFSRTPSGSILVDIRSTPAFTDEKVRLIAALPNVTDVTLESVPVTAAGLEGLRSIPNLQRLILNDSDVGGRVLETLAELPLRRTVTSLGLRGLPIDDSELASVGRLPRLYKIDLSGTKVTDEGLQHFIGTRVRIIDARKTRVSPEGVTRLRETMPEVEVAL